MTRIASIVCALLAAALSLALASSASAQAWACEGGVSALKPGVVCSYRFDADEASHGLDVQSCGAGIAAFDEGSGAAADLYAVKSAFTGGGASAPSGGESLVSFSADSSGETWKTGYPFLVVDPTTASGTARVTVKCGQEFGGGGSGEDVITIADPGTDEALYILDSATGKLVESPCTIEVNSGFGTISCPDATTIGGNVFSMHEHADAGQNTTCADRDPDKWSLLDVNEVDGTIEIGVCIGTTEVGKFTTEGLKAEDIAYPAIYNSSSEIPGTTFNNTAREIIYVYDESLSAPDIARMVESSRVAVSGGAEYGAGGKTSHSAYRRQVTMHVGSQGGVQRDELISGEGDPTVYTAHNRQVGGNTVAGDEGPDIVRGSVSDIGTVVPQGTLVNGIDPTDTAVSVTGLNETASRYVAAGTYMVFTDTATLVDIVSNDGSGGYVLGSGEAAGATDKCFAPVNEDITINGVTTNQYFRVVSDNGDDEITTEWVVLGTDKGQPPSNYTVTTGTDAGRIVDCEWIRGVIDSDGVAEGEDGPTWEIILIESAAHTLAADEPFQVTPYGVRSARGVRMIVQNSIGSDGAPQGFQANCRIEVDGREARCGTAFEDAGSGPLTSAGYYWDLGVDIDNSRRGYRFRTSPDLTPFQHFLVLDVDDDDWTNEGDTATVLQVTDDTDLNLGVSSTGWKIGSDPVLQDPEAEDIGAANVTQDQYEDGSTDPGTVRSALDGIDDKLGHVAIIRQLTTGNIISDDQCIRTDRNNVGTTTCDNANTWRTIHQEGEIFAVSAALLANLPTDVACGVGISLNESTSAPSEFVHLGEDGVATPDGTHRYLALSSPVSVSPGDVVGVQFTNGGDECEAGAGNCGTCNGVSNTETVDVGVAAYIR